MRINENLKYFLPTFIARGLDQIKRSSMKDAKLWSIPIPRIYHGSCYFYSSVYFRLPWPYKYTTVPRLTSLAMFVFAPEGIKQFLSTVQSTKLSIIVLLQMKIRFKLWRLYNPCYRQGNSVQDSGQKFTRTGRSCIARRNCCSSVFLLSYLFSRLFGSKVIGSPKIQ